jgi:RNA polymerase sigma-70 factor (ECF subfamily)
VGSPHHINVGQAVRYLNSDPPQLGEAKSAQLVSYLIQIYLNCARQNPPNRTVTQTRWVRKSKSVANRSHFGGDPSLMAEAISELLDSSGVNEPAAYRPGNQADFERLYEASYGKILGTLTAMLGDRAAAEDCAQDAFERAFRKWETWQPIAPAEAWVHRIAINAAVSHQRKMRLREVGEVIRRIGRPGMAPDPQQLVESRDLADALASLPPKQAAAIVLRHYHGYTNRAIAQALGIPERTVASRLAVAKKRLRVMLQQRDDERAPLSLVAAD